MHEFFLAHFTNAWGHKLKTSMNTEKQLNKKKKSFCLLPFHNEFCSLQNSYIIHYLIKCIIWTLLNIYVYINYSWEKIEVNCIVWYISFDYLKMKITIKTNIQIIQKDSKGLKKTSILYPIHFLIPLPWHHFSYSHIPFHYNREIINVIKIQNSPLQSFFVRPSFWVPWLNMPFLVLLLELQKCDKALQIKIILYIELLFHSYVHWFHNIMLDWDKNHYLLRN